MDSVFLRENRGHLSENLSTKNYSFGAKMRIIRRLPPNGSHPLRIPRNTRAQVKLAKSLAWPKEWGPCCVAFGRALRSHRRGQGFESLQVHHMNEVRFSNIFIEKRTFHFWKALLYQGLFFLYLGRYTLKIFK